MRKNITKTLIENRSLYSPTQIDETAIVNLSKACIQAHAEKLDQAEKDIFVHSKHPDIENMFKKNIKNIANFVLNCDIADEQIENDMPLVELIADNGQHIEITPSAISVMLAKLKPNFSSAQQRDDIYKTLAQKCAHDINEQNLNPNIPRVLLNGETKHKHNPIIQR